VNQECWLANSSDFDQKNFESIRKTSKLHPRTSHDGPEVK